jgi:hypothetical protein
MKPDTYIHLEDSDPLTIPSSMKEMVAIIRKMNYGEHRFLSELLRQRKASSEQAYEEFRRHTALLEQLLLEGYY